MKTLDVAELCGLLARRADPDFAESMQRYFPEPIKCYGVPNSDVTALAKEVLPTGDQTDARRAVSVADELVKNAGRHEEVLLGFALLRRRLLSMDADEVFALSSEWLETSVANWAQCDDLCLKLLHPLMMRHLDLIPRTQAWVASGSPWSRRAANVSVVKFVHRKVGSTIFELPLGHVFGNCVALMGDSHYYVQKGCGWLLKVTGAWHPEAVSEFLEQWKPEMHRDTFRDATGKLDPVERRRLLALPT